MTKTDRYLKCLSNNSNLINKTIEKPEQIATKEHILFHMCRVMGSAKIHRRKCLEKKTFDNWFKLLYAMQ